MCSTVYLWAVIFVVRCNQKVVQELNSAYLCALGGLILTTVSSSDSTETDPKTVEDRITLPSYREHSSSSSCFVQPDRVALPICGFGRGEVKRFQAGPTLLSTMPDSAPKQQNFTTIALVVEGGLAIVALALGWLLGQYPLESVSIASDHLPQLAGAIAWGLIATVPLLAVLLLSEWLSWGPLRKMSNVVDDVIVPLFRNATVFDLAAISLAAGLGEEMLFRGLLQAWVADHTGAEYGVYIGLAVASVVFGLCHFVTPTYALLAGLVGIYLGWLLIVTENLAAPVVCHAAYDFVALLYFCKWRGRDQSV